MPNAVCFKSHIDFDKANLFNKYFHSVFHDPSVVPNVDKLPDISGSLQVIYITTSDVYEVLVSLDIDKSLGKDEISPRVLQSCAESLCVPLHYLFTIYTVYALIPSKWKIHKIIPKAGNSNSATNYRPISFSSNTSEVLKRLIYNKIIDLVSKSISLVQFGFTKRCSTLQQMLLFLNYIINSPSQKSKAFDSWHFTQQTVDVGTLWTWFKDYLTHRHQQVSINNIYSNFLLVVFGVPQGSTFLAICCS